MKLPHIALMMIVKNEAKTLPRLIESVRPIITSWRIIDTGSTDGTQQIILKELSQIPGEFSEEPWINFGINRSRLISGIPDGADYALLLDADHIVEIDSLELLAEQLSAAPQADLFMLDVREATLEYRMPYLVRTGKNYFYVGATHEYLDARETLSRSMINAIRIRHVGDGGSKGDKLERDVALLTEAIASGDESARNHFYLGQSFEGLGKRSEASRHYQEAALKTVWDEEKYVALLRSGRLAAAENRFEDALDNQDRAISACPDRLEARYEAAKLFASKKQHASALAILRDLDGFERKPRILFLEPWLQLWGYEIEIAVHLWHLGEVAAAKTIFEQIMTRPDLPPTAVNLIATNLSYC